ncbi:hypothetical protein D3C87_2082240 [compost metagenome]
MEEHRAAYIEVSEYRRFYRALRMNSRETGVSDVYDPYKWADTRKFSRAFVLLLGSNSRRRLAEIHQFIHHQGRP